MSDFIDGAIAPQAQQRVIPLSSDVITVVCDPLRPLGKQFKLGPDGHIQKRSATSPSLMLAKQHHVPDPAAMAALLEAVAGDPNAAIINAVFPGVPVGERFLILSELEIENRLGLAGRDAQKGVHQAEHAGEKLAAVGRFKENVAPSSWQYFDRDVDQHTPVHLASLGHAAWVETLDKIAPGLASASMVRVGSVSSRVRRAGASPQQSTNAHTWVQFTDAADCERLRAALLAQAADAGLTWLKPRFSSKHPGQIVGHGLTTLTDLSVLTPGRLVFIGQPVLASEGLALLPPSIEVLNPVGGRLDTARVPSADRERFAAATARAGAKMQLRNEAGTLAVDDYSLQWSTELELQDGRVLTVEEATGELEPGGKLRCQAPCRDSVSYAGFFRIGTDGRPCVHDVGTGVTHWLKDDDFIAGEFDDLDALADSAMQEIEQRIAVGELAGESPAALKAAVAAIKQAKERDGVSFAERHTQALMTRLRAATGEPAPAARFTPIPAAEFAAGRPPGWIVKDILPRAELAVIYGASGSGKSFFTLDLVAAVARGMPWRGYRVEAGRVVYVAAEGAGGFRNRLQAYAKRHDVDLAQVPLAVIADAPNLMQDDDKAMADAINGTGGAAVIVVDTLAQATPGANENAGEDMGKVIARCKRLHRATGALVLLVHHSGKDEGRGARGWSGIRAAVDAEIEINRDGDVRTAKLTKQKDGEDGKFLGFRLESVSLGLDDYGDAVTSCAVEYVDHAPPRLKAPKGAVQRLVYRAVQDASGFGAIPMDVLIATVANSMPHDPEARDKRREHVMRAVKGLQESAFICVFGDQVSLPHAPNSPNGAFEE